MMDDIIRRILDQDPLSQVLFLDRADRVVAREVLINRILRGKAEMGGSRLRFVPRLSLNELDGLVAAVRVVLDVVPQYTPTSYAVATEALSLGTPVITMAGMPAAPEQESHLVLCNLQIYLNGNVFLPEV